MRLGTCLSRNISLSSAYRPSPLCSLSLPLYASLRFYGEGQTGRGRGMGGRGGGNNYYDNNYNRTGTSRGSSVARGAGRGGRERGGRGGGAPRNDNRSPESFLAENAETLHRLKQSYKSAKSVRERREFLAEGRRNVNGVRIDPSTQDEKSVLMFLNAAATFHCFPSEGIEQGIMWARKNLGALNPQNVALFANAIGVLNPPGASEVMRDEIGKATLELLSEMTTVEVVMILQAIARLHVYECEELELQMFQRLVPCVQEMPVQQLSTLATVLAHHRFKHKHAELHAELFQAVVAKVTPAIATMHSKEAVTLLCTATYLDWSKEVLVQLAARVTETARFHTDEEVADLLNAVVHMTTRLPERSPELVKVLDALKLALVTRLERVSEFVSAQSLGQILITGGSLGLQFSEKTETNMFNRLTFILAYDRVGVNAARKLSCGFAWYKFSYRPQEALDMVTSKLLGIVPSRQALRERTFTGEQMHEFSVPETYYISNYVNLLRSRIQLEDAYARNGVKPPSTLTKTLPAKLEKHIKSLKLSAILWVVQYICKEGAEVTPYRNTVCDDKLLQSVEEMLTANKADLMKDISEVALTKFKEEMNNVPKAAKILSLLS